MYFIRFGDTLDPDPNHAHNGKEALAGMRWRRQSTCPKLQLQRFARGQYGCSLVVDLQLYIWLLKGAFEPSHDDVASLICLFTHALILHLQHTSKFLGNTVI